jgi:hypothetical protein
MTDWAEEMRIEREEAEARIASAGAVVLDTVVLVLRPEGGYAVWTSSVEQAQAVYVDRAPDVVVPAKFFYDHEDRGCIVSSGDGARWQTFDEAQYIVKRTKARVTVRLSWADLYDLAHDASYYTDPASFDRSMFGLVRSAVATIEAIARVVPLDELERRAGRRERSIAAVGR